jgi:hypothetical protein
LNLFFNLITSLNKVTIAAHDKLVEFYDNPVRNKAAGLTSLKSEVTLVSDLLVNDTIKYTIGYTLPDYPSITVKVNNVSHTAAIKSKILTVVFQGPKALNQSNLTLQVYNSNPNKIPLFKRPS